MNFLKKLRENFIFFMKKLEKDNDDKKSQEDSESNNELEEGLPESANKKNENYILSGILTVIAIIIALSWVYVRHQPSAQETEVIIEEQFNTEQEPPALKTNENKVAFPQTEAKTNVEPIQTGPSPEDIAKRQALMARLQAPIFTDDNDTSTPETTSSKNEHSSKTGDSNMQYLSDVSSETTPTVQASLLEHRSTLIAEGSLIDAVVESARDSDLPGYIRAIVSQPVYSEDGSRALIVPGSRLIGQYRSGMKPGQSRVFVVWTRLIEPNGINVALGSPGVDNLGVAGEGADQVDRHFWEMFGSSSLLSLIGAGASNIGVNNTDQYNAAQAYRQAVSESFSQSAENSLQDVGYIPPTLHLNQGKHIKVFVAKDLQFDDVLSEDNSNVDDF